MRPAQLLVNMLKKYEMTIAFAESMSCGMAASAMGSISGTSEVFMGSIVCYDKQVKKKLLNIPASVIQKHTAESQQVTDALARHLKNKITADLHVAITGLAAPGGTETKSKPVGTVFISVLLKDKLYRQRKKFNGTPKQIRKKACNALFLYAFEVVTKKMKVSG